MVFKRTDGENGGRDGVIVRELRQKWKRLLESVLAGIQRGAEG